MLTPIAIAKRSKADLCCFGVLLWAATASCLAQENSYALLAGRDKPVCGAYQQLLTLQQTEDYVKEFLEPEMKTYRCDRIVPSTISDLGQPTWKKLGGVERKLLVQLIESYLEIPGNAEATIPRRPVQVDPGWFARSEEFGYAAIESTQADIDSDGKAETVVKYRRNGNTCYSHDRYQRYAPWTTVLVVVNDDLTQIDVSRTHVLMQNPSKEYVANLDDMDAATNERRRGIKVDPQRFREILMPTEFAAGKVDFRGYDLLTYGGEFYFDRWVEDITSIDFGTLAVFKISEGHAERVCRFEMFPKQ